MTKTISQDLRKRVIDYIEAGHSCRAAARHFQVSESFPIKLFAKWKTEGSIAPRPRARPPGSGKLAPYREFLRTQVEAQPDITLWELTECLKQQHGIDMHFSNVFRCLNVMGLSYKKTLVALRSEYSWGATERYREDVVRKRTAWIHWQKLMRLEPGRGWYSLTKPPQTPK